MSLALDIQQLFQALMGTALTAVCVALYRRLGAIEQKLEQLNVWQAVTDANMQHMRERVEGQSGYWSRRLTALEDKQKEREANG